MKIKKVLITVIIIITCFWIGLRFLGLKFYNIPTSSMENTLPVGSKIMVWKNQFEPERFEIIVYQNPEQDTITIPYSYQSYYAMKRVMDKQTIASRYSIKYMPLTDREQRIGRCVGLPGDKLYISKSDLYVNDEIYVNSNIKKSYLLTIKDKMRLNSKFLVTHGIKAEDLHVFGEETKVNLSKAQATKLKKQAGIERVKLDVDNSFRDVQIFPHSSTTPSTRDTFGPFIIPQKGKEIKLTLDNLPLYKRLITAYEKNDLKVLNNTIFINNIKTNTYTPKMNYYAIICDNRHLSIDSRHWGFLPENHIYGKVLKVFKPMF